ncbi:1-phosphofructokinase [Haladaptatus sp. DYSN1]|uniref:1-phosphofructokinase n=1 Tax=unclassified Haladaptatus TaxID=2622732 RepID=UPI0024055EBF|nr:1-phosphofructokinase [Haladaptatus sp. DYSN1]
MILTVTLNPAVDHTLTLDQPLTHGAVARTGDAQYDAGGKGINVSKYLTKRDVETYATGLIGGFLGEFIETRLDETGVHADFVEIAGRTRLNTTLHAPDGEFKINQHGPTVSLDAIDRIVERAHEHDPDSVVVAGSLPKGLDASAVDRIARAGPWETVVDVGGDLLTELDAEFALCKPNREELSAATGLPTKTLDECIAAGKALQRRGYDRVAASLGGDGALLVTPETVFHATALDVRVVDTVGAGDAFLAGLLSAYARGTGDEGALKEGVAVASEVVTTPGTTVPMLSNVQLNTGRVTVSVCQ